MSRSEYSEDLDQWSLIRWRGAVASAIRGARGQAFFKELLRGMDAMPERRLITEDLEKDGAVCAIGVVGKARGIDMSNIDPEDSYTVARVFQIADALAREIVHMNDEGTYKAETPEERFDRMREWVKRQIQAETHSDIGR